MNSDPTRVSALPPASPLASTDEVVVQTADGPRTATIDALKTFMSTHHPSEYERRVFWSDDRSIDDSDIQGAVIEREPAVTWPERHTSSYLCVWVAGDRDLIVIEVDGSNRILSFTRTTRTWNGKAGALYVSRDQFTQASGWTTREGRIA